MKKVVHQLVILICLIQVSTLVLGQTTLYTTPNPKTNSKAKPEDVFKLKMKDVLAFPTTTTQGLIAMMRTCSPACSPTPKVKFEIYAYDDTREYGKGRLLYSTTVTTTSTDFAEVSEVDTDWWYSHFDAFTRTTTIKRRLLEYLFHGTDYPPLASLLTYELPVVVEATTTNATLQRINIPGLGNTTPQKLFNINSDLDFSALTKAPSRKSIINTYEDLGSIQITHYEWDPYNDTDHITDPFATTPIDESQYMDGQGITIAKLNMTDPKNYKDYDIKFTYLFKDRSGNDIIPERCITDDKPLGGQMDVLSHAVAREGAVFGINGTFYDYYYRCVPSVRQLIKIDGVTMAYPNVLSHKLKGAIGIDFTKPQPIKFQAVDVTSPSVDYTSPANLGDIQHPNVFRSLQGYSNVMSGGHFSSFNEVYDFQIPEECKEGNVHPWTNIYSSAKYPWEDYVDNSVDPTIKLAKETDLKNWDKLKWQVSGATDRGWSFLACARTDFTGGYQGMYKNYFLCDKLDPSGSNPNYIEYRNLLTCVDSRRAGDEFGSGGRQIRKARTFLAWKNNNLYMVAVDGLRLYRNATTNAVENYNQSVGQKNDDSQWGFTLTELGRFYSQMNFEYLLHLDGGTSTEFFINGKGMAQRPIESFATLDGPLRQRYTSSFVLVVPKFHPDQIEGLGFNQQHLKLDNSRSTEGNRSIIEMTPSLPKINNADGTSGLFSTAFRIEDKIENEGAVLFSISESAVKSNNIFVAGIGKIPAGLLDSLKQFAGDDAKYLSALSKNDQASYAVVVSKGKIQQAWFDGTKSSSYYMNSKWHRFTVFQDRKNTGLSIDGEMVDNTTGTTSDFFNLPAVTHMMMGGAMFGPNYYTSLSKTELDNVVLLTGDNVRASTVKKVTAAVGDMIPKGLDHLWTKRAGAYLLQMEEVEGMHAFAADESGNNKFFGLKLNAERMPKDLQHAQISGKGKSLK